MMAAAKSNFKGVRLVSIFIMSLIAVGSLAFAAGVRIGGDTKHNNPDRELRDRLVVVERLCERWDERWKNLEKWMTRIESKLDSAAER